MENIIASRKILSVALNGEERPFHISIGCPYQAGQDEWACPVAIDGLMDKLPDIHGIDSFQSLVLAIKLIGRLLQQFLDDGGMLYWSTDGDELTVHSFLSGLAIPLPLNSLDPKPPHQ